MVLAAIKLRSSPTKPWSAPAWPSGSAQSGGYSKGMRQRIRLAQAIAHHPSVLVLDEPLNGLDPMARSESIALFQAIAKTGYARHHLQPYFGGGRSHLDRVVLMSSGYVVAEGQIREFAGSPRSSHADSCSHVRTPRVGGGGFELDHVSRPKS